MCVCIVIVCFVNMCVLGMCVCWECVVNVCVLQIYVWIEPWRSEDNLGCCSSSAVYIFFSLPLSLWNKIIPCPGTYQVGYGKLAG
jgi:hypothetical protein